LHLLSTALPTTVGSLGMFSKLKMFQIKIIDLNDDFIWRPVLEKFIFSSSMLASVKAGLWVIIYRYKPKLNFADTNVNVDCHTKYSIM
jgi:hypothetical protein